jgi:hypothetical protein
MGKSIASAAGGLACNSITVAIGAEVGGAIGFLGNILGAEVGLPIILAGVVLGKSLVTFLKNKYGNALCEAAMGYSVDRLCTTCPSTAQYGPGTITCNGGACQDALSDTNNCGAYGRVVSAFPS